MGDTNIRSRSTMFTTYKTSGTTTAIADRTQTMAMQTKNSDTSGTGRYRVCHPRWDESSTINSSRTRELSRPTRAASTCFTGTNSIGNTALRSSARFAFTDTSPDVTASLNPRYGINPANTNSTN